VNSLSPSGFAEIVSDDVFGLDSMPPKRTPGYDYAAAEKDND
jgi:hypothetical protein